MITITVLHNEFEVYQRSKSGFSVLIEAFGKRILFDTSLSDDIIKNAERGKISLREIDCIVLSHGHTDHTEGLRFIDFSNVKSIVAHPDCFQKKFSERGGYIGIPLCLDYLKRKTNLVLTKEPFWIEEDKIVFLGQIPRKTDFEAKTPVGYLENGEADFVLEDSAIAINTNRGIVIVTGCSHSGVCNIIEYTKGVCQSNKIYAVLGGFHLFNNRVIDKTIEFIKREHIERVYPAHCVSEYGFAEFKKIGGKRLSTLQRLVF
ncbi:MBL fold metallo-hydrolase [Candidatus Woesearchaeota archaeon]|nr:MBL fold metallo-hydrolase [Candidatus Woesearchaeota archaeon]RLE43042.1 MAG: MBL fold metallo-hydrolase [Candidatus Woesearchaeota archaeon]